MTAQKYSGPSLAAIIALQALTAGCTVNALAAYGEEAAWRGYLLDRLRDDL